jgi:hypothetical protein
VAFHPDRLERLEPHECLDLLRHAGSAALLRSRRQEGAPVGVQSAPIPARRSDDPAADQGSNLMVLLGEMQERGITVREANRTRGCEANRTRG